ncbi:4-hydroxy-tetrahydrodipicolinate synthase [Bradyrhizobium sp. LHD-71]|uniref:4-hydroxy-tetrahydrodipicolinate synthase n=1 Tax=Bradyrhizobium sp. LHD-71 TaxID=3072141 RepID=UPI00280E4447|nr:4-hydroxy-tetrahydrodipicolinate synthase [Bradyrhizobium sp. LHD-71]MDQ8726713.1 4-hydroxy-tetrahydrodipicolinate synthase [Bradyrhizobium sp. LHD-71]
MQTANSVPQGIWLPLVTPFRDGMFDEKSARRLAGHYASAPVDGFILAATTGEGLTVDEDEIERYTEICRDAIESAGRRLQFFLGLSGSDTRKLIKALDLTSAWPVDGYLIACPYYTRPSQLGLYRHFCALAESTSKPIMIYNIPYRTGVNLGNVEMLRLAEHRNIVGVKDCCADAAQSFDLLRMRPKGFSVLTGEDALFHNALTQGADGGVLASAHIATDAFATVRNLMRDGDHSGALASWRALIDLPRLLFAEPSPAPIKHWLWRTGLIDSPEVRLPMSTVSDALAKRIDQEIQRRRML